MRALETELTVAGHQHLPAPAVQVLGARSGWRARSSGASLLLGGLAHRAVARVQATAKVLAAEDSTHLVLIGGTGKEGIRPRSVAKLLDGADDVASRPRGHLTPRLALRSHRDGRGSTSRLIEWRRLTPARRAALKPDEIEGIGAGHAEITGVSSALAKGLTPTDAAASRPICSDCAKFLVSLGISPLSPLKPPKKQ